MKKFLGLMVAVVGLLPFVVSADSLSHHCTENGNTTNCTVAVKLDTPASELTVTLTEEGGADVTSIVESSDDWDLSKSENNGVHTIVLYSSTLENLLEGEYDLFNFSFTSSGEEDCQVSLNFDGKSVTITPEEPTTDEPTDNKETGATLPYIALGVIALGAAGAYIVTKNKSKMYRI